MPGILTDSVRRQVAALDLAGNRPLIICDADEVLFEFMKSLEGYLETRGYYMDLQSFAIAGNIKHRETDEPFPTDQMGTLLADFFAAATATMTPVPHATESLSQLSDAADIVILTNMPEAHKEARLSALAKHGMDYPVIANEGVKGAAVRALSEQSGRPVFFLDDLPPNITSVRRGLPETRIIHFIADERLAKLLGPAEDADHRIDHWPDVVDVITRAITDHENGS